MDRRPADAESQATEDMQAAAEQLLRDEPKKGDSPPSDDPVQMQPLAHGASPEETALQNGGEPPKGRNQITYLDLSSNRLVGGMRSGVFGRS